MDPKRVGDIKTMSELNRYQNPEIFEKLAMAYAAGTLHGRARLRFEKLKSEHFYLEATTSAYESKRKKKQAGLVGYPQPMPPLLWPFF